MSDLAHRRFEVPLFTVCPDCGYPVVLLNAWSATAWEGVLLSGDDACEMVPDGEWVVVGAPRGAVVVMPREPLDTVAYSVHEHQPTESRRRRYAELRAELLAIEIGDEITIPPPS